LSSSPYYVQEQGNENDDEVTRSSSQNSQPPSQSQPSQPTQSCDGGGGGIRKGSSSSTKYYTFARVGGGLSFAQLKQIDERLKEKWIPAEKNRVPSYIAHRNIKKDLRPTFWIKPEDSIIMQVRG